MAFLSRRLPRRLRDLAAMRGERAFDGPLDAGLAGGTQRGQRRVGGEQVTDLIRAGIEPVDLLAPGAAGVGQHVGIAAVGLGLAGVQVGGAAHHQARHIRHRRAATARASWAIEPGWSITRPGVPVLASTVQGAGHSRPGLGHERGGFVRLVFRP
jgi:hypothetical protein